MVEAWLAGNPDTLASAEAADEPQDHETAPEQTRLHLCAPVDQCPGASPSGEHGTPVCLASDGAGVGLERIGDSHARPGPGHDGDRMPSRLPISLCLMWRSASSSACISRKVSGGRAARTGRAVLRSISTSIQVPPAATDRMQHSRSSSGAVFRTIPRTPAWISRMASISESAQLHTMIAIAGCDVCKLQSNPQRQGRQVLCRKSPKMGATHSCVQRSHLCERASALIRNGRPKNGPAKSAMMLACRLLERAEFLAAPDRFPSGRVVFRAQCDLQICARLG